MSSFPQSFLSKKRTILSQLSIPAEEYDDLSPKGSIDVGIRELINEINESEGWVTTSSCAGRVSIFLEGRRKDTAAAILEEESDGNGARLGDGEVGEVRAAGAGGKGGGGNWLFVSHDPVVVDDKSRGDLAAMLGMKRVDEKKEVQKHELVDDEILGKRFIHFKFEPMVCFLNLPGNFHQEYPLTRTDLTCPDGVSLARSDYPFLCIASRLP